jgi:hypothetical protein
LRQLHILQSCPSDLYFAWQTRVQLYNARKTNCSQLFRVLVFVPHDRIHLSLPECWKELEKDFPETKFFYYWDKENILRVINIFNYIPLLRPFCIDKHLEEYPELSKDAVFYIDSDVLLHKGIDFLSPYLDDDIIYMSDGKSYNNSDYFDSKIKDVLLYKLEEFKKVDVLEEASRQCGITRQMCEANKNATGAAQYLLKNKTLSSQFWKDVFNTCCSVKLYLGNINRRFFESEDKGYQSWATDIFVTNWLTWGLGYTTATPSSLDFCWATDSAQRFNETNIYHDAGAFGNQMFLKRKMDYVNNVRTPFQDDLSHVSPQYASWHYTNEIIETKNFFNL